ncbi:MAG: hypothetical protein WBE26_13315 [Phycisphaerae bacterium]
MPFDQECKRSTCLLKGGADITVLFYVKREVAEKLPQIRREDFIKVLPLAGDASVSQISVSIASSWQKKNRRSRSFAVHTYSILARRSSSP